MTDRTLRLSRRQWLAAAGCGAMAAVGSDGWLIEPNRILVTSHSLVAGSDGGSTTRIVQLTDLHLHDVGHHVRAVAAQTNALRPDLIALTGDSVDRSDALPLLAEFLELLPSETRRSRSSAIGSIGPVSTPRSFGRSTIGITAACS